jgi:hypothetical protein
VAIRGIHEDRSTSGERVFDEETIFDEEAKSSASIPMSMASFPLAG